MKLNNKGFALTSIIYMLIVLFLMIMLLILANLAQRKVVLDKLKYDVKEKLNQTVSINAQNLPYQNTTTGIFYETLSDALKNSDNGNTIKVLKDVKEIASAMNTKGTTSNPVVLDLNGKTIDYIGNEKTVILNTGNLEIKDTASNGKITTSTIMGNGRVIHNKTDGNFTLTSGKLEVAAPSSANAIIAEGKTVTINGGEISVASEVDSAIVIEIDNTFLKINNGILHSEGYGVYNRTGKIEINGGNISSNKKATITNNSTLGNTQEDPVLKITGGTISSTGNYAINNTKANTTLYLSGGNISSTGDHALVSNGHLVMTNGIIDAYSGCGIYITGNEGAEVSGGIITKKINPITNEWVGGATLQITGSGTTTIKGNTIVQNEEGNTSNVIYNGGTGTIIVDENATIENKSSTVTGTNYNSGKIIVRGGTIKSNGNNVLSSAGKNGTIEVTGGELYTTGTNAIYVTGAGAKTIIGTVGADNTYPKISGRIYGYTQTPGDIIINSGTINAPNSQAIRTKGNVTVNGGIISSDISYGIISETANSKITINDGYILSQIEHTVTTTNETGGELEINGGTIVKNEGTKAAVNNLLGTTTINGGTILSKQGIGVNSTTGTFNFNGGKITGTIGNSVSKEPITQPDYMRKIATNDTLETSTLGWATDSNDTLIVNDSAEYTATRTSSTSEKVTVKLYTINAPFSANEVYQLEVDVKGNGELYNYFHGASNYWQIARTETFSGNVTTRTDGRNIINLTDEYTHYEVRFTLKPTGNADVKKYILFRLDSGDATANIKNIKLYKIN